MGTPCEYCGSRGKACQSFREYANCDTALDNSEQDEVAQAAAALFDAVDWELRHYPDDGEDQPEAQVAIFPDDINTPKHYAGYEIEPITFIMRNNMPYADGNVVKYVCRHRMKNGLEDIQKAIKYLKFIAKQEYGAEL